MRNISEWYQKNKFQTISIVVIFVFALVARFYNYQQRLFFIYDQGRDAHHFRSIAEGDLTLIGPPTGIEGFFVGPLWYYAGVPGYVLGQGNPYVIALWQIGLASLALPFFWLISRHFFPRQPGWSTLTFALMALVPGSVLGATFPWNPLITIPAMAAALVALLQARTSRWWLLVAFMFLGAVLQGEFASSILIVLVLLMLVGWMRPGKTWTETVSTYLLAVVGLGITIIPQLVFELKNNWLLTRSLLTGILHNTTNASFGFLLTHRPRQLLETTRMLFLGFMPGTGWLGLVIVAVIISAVWQIWRQPQLWKSMPTTRFAWQLVSLIAITPYVQFMLWRGNNGNFFHHYLTPHFIVLVPLLVLGVKELPHLPLWRFLASWQKTKAVIISSVMSSVQVCILTLVIFCSWWYLFTVWTEHNNQAGLNAIETVTHQVLTWQAEDQSRFTAATGQPFTTTIVTFTPNFLTAQYDYVMHWVATERQLPLPHTAPRTTDAIVYLVIEPDHEYPEIRFKEWYETKTQGRLMIRRTKVGVLNLEAWADPVFASTHQLSPYVPTMSERLNW